MGEPVKIVDLARDMIRLSGLVPNEDVEIVFTGVRPGEKLLEELGTGAEDVHKTTHEKILLGRRARVSTEEVLSSLSRLEEICRDGDGYAVREELRRLIPEAIFSETSRGARVPS